MDESKSKCPQCKSEQFTLVETPGDMGVVVHLDWSTGAPVDFYLCLDCGFGQLWMNEKNLEKARRKHWKMK